MASIGTEILIKFERRPCFVGERKAWFHRWISKDIPMIKVNAMLTQKALDRIAERAKSGLIDSYSDVVMQRSTLGLVEYEDGNVAEVEPTSIRFDVEREKEE